MIADRPCRFLVEAKPTKLVISRSRSYALTSPAAGPFAKSAQCEANVFMSTDSCMHVSPHRNPKN